MEGVKMDALQHTPQMLLLRFVNRDVMEAVLLALDQVMMSA
jgi:hypothetical protein